MKIFNQVEGFENKVNFVDENNVFVGFDMGSCCCEDFGWYLTKQDSLDGHKFELPEGTHELPGWVFDPTYCRVIDDNGEGGTVEFRLTNNIHECSQMYLCLYNFHNGYYAHGFVFKDNDVVIMEDYL